MGKDAQQDLREILAGHVLYRLAQCGKSARAVARTFAMQLVDRATRRSAPWSVLPKALQPSELRLLGHFTRS
jgi:hypothetical protein